MLGLLYFYINFGNKEQLVTLNMVPGSTALVIPHQDLDELVRNYQTLHKTVGRSEDGYSEHF